MKENPNSERITVQLPPEEKQYIEKQAEIEGRSTSAEALYRLRQTFGSDFKADTPIRRKRPYNRRKSA